MITKSYLAFKYLSSIKISNFIKIIGMSNDQYEQFINKISVQ